MKHKVQKTKTRDLSALYTKDFKYSPEYGKDSLKNVNSFEYIMLSFLMDFEGDWLNKAKFKAAALKKGIEVRKLLELSEQK